MGAGWRGDGCPTLGARKGSAGLAVTLWALMPLLALLSLPGCLMVGISTVGACEGETDNPEFAANDFIGRVVEDAHRTEPDSSARLLKEWGEPDSRDEEDDGSERWRYTGFLRGAGVIVFVLLPIPLVVPTGLESVEFTVRDGLVVHAKSSANTMPWGMGCGWAPGFMHGGGFFAGTWSEPTDRFKNPFE